MASLNLSPTARFPKLHAARFRAHLPAKSSPTSRTSASASATATLESLLQRARPLWGSEAALIGQIPRHSQAVANAIATEPRTTFPGMPFSGRQEVGGAVQAAKWSLRVRVPLYANCSGKTTPILIPSSFPSYPPRPPALLAGVALALKSFHSNLPELGLNAYSDQCLPRN